MSSHVIEEGQKYRDIERGYLRGGRPYGLIIRKLWVDEDGQTQLRIEKGPLDGRCWTTWSSMKGEKATITADELIARISEDEVRLLG